jgi:hypothetical protein
MRSLTILALGAVSLVLPQAARAQLPRPPLVLGRYDGPPIAARQATAQEVGRMAVPCPMLLDLSLEAYGSNRSFRDLDPRQSWLVTETAAFECNGARVDFLQVERTILPGRVQIRVSPRLAPELPGRTVDLTVAFVAGGVEVQSRSARVSTRGVAGEGQVVTTPPQTVSFDFEFSEQDFVALFAPGRSPVLRLILEA